MKNEFQHESHIARRVLSAAGLCVIALASVGALAASALYARTYQNSNQMAAVVSAVLVNLTNGDRASDDLSRLAVNPKLVAAAQAKANDEATKEYFAHTSPDGTTSWQWFRDAGYSFADAGENLAVDFTDSTDVEHAWMNSPTHRANILDPKFTEVGIATAQGMYQGHPATFVVEMFGTPAASSSASVSIVTKAAAPTELAVATTKVLGATVVTATSTVATAATSTASSTPVVPAVIIPSAPAPRAAPFWGVLATTPRGILRATYLAFAFMLLLAFVLTSRLEFRRHHLTHMYAIVVLLVFMGGLFAVADHFIFATPVISQSASMISYK